MYMYAGAGFFYNKEKIKDPPKTWIEFFDRAGKGEFGKSVSLPDIPYGWTPAFLWTYAKVLGGDINKMDPAFDMLKKVRPHVVKFWANAGEIERMISSREVDIGVFWDGRIYSMMDAAVQEHTDIDLRSNHALDLAGVRAPKTTTCGQTFFSISNAGSILLMSPPRTFA